MLNAIEGRKRSTQGESKDDLARTKGWDWC